LVSNEKKGVIGLFCNEIIFKENFVKFGRLLQEFKSSSFVPFELRMQTYIFAIIYCRMKLLVLLMAVGVALAESMPEEEREKRQSGYYQGQGETRGPPIKQFAVTRFPGVGGTSPQGFLSPAVDEDEEEDVVSRNTVAPSPVPQALLLLRQSQPTPQPQPIYRRPAAADSNREYQQARRPSPQQQGGRSGQYPNQQLQASLKKHCICVTKINQPRLQVCHII
jgi:hypothetical protein